mgnify:CR=1 FL=1
MNFTICPSRFLVQYRVDRNLVISLLFLSQVKEEMGQSLKTALHTAIEYGHDRVARVLLRHGVAVRSVDWCGQTPLHYASQAGKPVMSMDGSQ